MALFYLFFSHVVAQMQWHSWLTVQYGHVQLGSLVIRDGCSLRQDLLTQR